jgi:hypothetical protein
MRRNERKRLTRRAEYQQRRGLQITEHGRRFVKSFEFYERIADIIIAQEGTIKFERDVIQRMSAFTSLALCMDEDGHVTATDAALCEMTHHPEVPVVICEAIPIAMNLLGDVSWQLDSDDEFAFAISGIMKDALIARGLVRRVEYYGRKGILILHQDDIADDIARTDGFFAAMSRGENVCCPFCGEPMARSEVEVAGRKLTQMQCENDDCDGGSVEKDSCGPIFRRA